MHRRCIRVSCCRSLVRISLPEVTSDEAAIFFRRRTQPFEPAIHRVYTEDVDRTYEELQSRGAIITDPLETKPWGIRQFTVSDLDGNIFYFHAG